MVLKSGIASAPDWTVLLSKHDDMSRHVMEWPKVSLASLCPLCAGKGIEFRLNKKCDVSSSFLSQTAKRPGKPSLLL
jgi:hypothetical protein